MNQNQIVTVYVILSILAAILLTALTFFSSTNPRHLTLNNRVVIGTVFIASCLFGISLAFYPGWLNKIIKHNDPISKKEKNMRKTVRFKGHHPNCDTFKMHTIVSKKKTYCAGCLGLLIGCSLSIILIIGYIITSLKQSVNLSAIIFGSGIVLIGSVYIEILISRKSPIIHFFLNTLLIIGFFLVTISVLEITRNTYFGLIAVLFSFLWLDTRIQISHWQHQRICRNCSKDCKVYC